MAKQETPEQVRQWFLAQISRLWPVASGSLSLRRNRCIRPRCPTCHSGEGHPSYALYIRRGTQRSVLYVPDEMTDVVTQALANGKTFQALLREAGLRYLKAIKVYRRKT